LKTYLPKEIHVMKPQFHKGIIYVAILLAASLACGQSASTPAPTDPSLLFQDDFSKTSGDWGRVFDSADGSSVGYADSGYRILVNKPQNISWGVSGSNLFEGDVIVEVDAIKKGGAPDGFLGIVCRDEKVNGQEHSYFLIFDGNGAASINKFADNSVSSLGNAQSDPILALNEGDTVHVRAECVGNTLTLYVNDVQLVTATDDSFSSGDAGLIAGAADTPGTDVMFDNFSVHRP
jgi:hypothetical protein